MTPPRRRVEPRLARGARAGDGGDPAAPGGGVASVNTSTVVAGFGGGHTFGRPPTPRTGILAARR